VRIDELECGDHLWVRCEAREGTLGKREGPTINIYVFSKVLGEKGAPFPPWGVRF
jgi:hypothetical protein